MGQFSRWAPRQAKALAAELRQLRSLRSAVETFTSFDATKRGAKPRRMPTSSAAWSVVAIFRLLRNRKEEGQPEAERGSKGQRFSDGQHVGGTCALPVCENLPRLRGFTTTCAIHGFAQWHTTRRAPRKREGRNTRLPGTAREKGPLQYTQY